MGWYRVALTEVERVVVTAERDAHPDAHVRRKMLVLRLLHCGLTRVLAAEVAGLGRATVQRYVAAYRDGRLDGLRRWGVTGPVSDLAAHTAAIRDSLELGIANRGSSVDDYVDVYGAKGRQQEELQVYGRGGQPCHSCGTPLTLVRLGGRATVFCRRCQR